MCRKLRLTSRRNIDIAYDLWPIATSATVFDQEAINSLQRLSERQHNVTDRSIWPWHDKLLVWVIAAAFADTQLHQPRYTQPWFTPRGLDSGSKRSEVNIAVGKSVLACCNLLLWLDHFFLRLLDLFFSLVYSWMTQNLIMSITILTVYTRV